MPYRARPEQPARRTTDAALPLCVHDDPGRRPVRLRTGSHCTGGVGGAPTRAVTPTMCIEPCPPPASAAVGLRHLPVPDARTEQVLRSGRTYKEGRGAWHIVRGALTAAWSYGRSSKRDMDRPRGV